MIEWIENGDILHTRAVLIVCPVNCVGVLGAGLAKAMADAWPGKWHAQYKAACNKGLVRPGVPRTFPLNLGYGEDIVLFPTKDDWRSPSRIEWIERGLNILRDIVDHRVVDAGGWPSIALPAVGCGLGGLRWEDVRPLIEFHFADYAGRVEVYAPKGPSE